MNVNQIINMVMRIVMRKAISKGIDAGVSRATRGRGQPQQKRKLADIPPEELPPQQRVRAERRARRAAEQDGQG